LEVAQVDNYDVTGEEPDDPSDREQPALRAIGTNKVIGTDITFTNGWGELSLYNCTRNASNACYIATGTGSTAPVYSGTYGRFKKLAGGGSTASTIMLFPTYSLPPDRRFKAKLRAFRPSTTHAGRLTARLKVDGVIITTKNVTSSTAANKWVTLSFTWDNTTAANQFIQFSVEGWADGSTAAFEYRIDSVERDDVATPQ
jgi:hypothetical protein